MSSGKPSDHRLAIVAIIISMVSAAFAGVTFAESRKSNQYTKDLQAWDELEKDVNKFSNYRHRIGINLNRADVQKDVWRTKSWLPFCQRLAQLESEIRLNRIRRSGGITDEESNSKAFAACLTARDEVASLWVEFMTESGWNHLTTHDRAQRAWLWDG